MYKLSTYSLCGVRNCPLYFRTLCRSSTYYHIEFLFNMKTLSGVALNNPVPLWCPPTSVELPHHRELEVLAVVPGVVQAEHSGSGLGLQLEGGQDESLVHPLSGQAPLQQVWQAVRWGEQIIDCWERDRSETEKQESTWVMDDEIWIFTTCSGALIRE